jgi:hypothetical protein
LGERDPFAVIAATPGELRRLADTLGAAGAERSPAPGKWCAREILCHLADCEVVFAFRLRQALAEDYHVIQPFDQDKWAARYRAFDVQTALDVFTAVRESNRRLIAGVSPEESAKKLTHPERGEMTFRTVVETMAGHDLNHLAQIERIAARPAGA